MFVIFFFLQFKSPSMVEVLYIVIKRFLFNLFIHLNHVNWLANFYEFYTKQRKILQIGLNKTILKPTCNTRTGNINRLIY